MFQLTAIVICAVPFILLVWTVVGLITPGLGMHDGDI
jgi:hypothetical protein